MSYEVDNRVVEMEFNNSRFESNVQTSLNTLDKLQSALQLKGASDGISDIQRASDRFSLDGMSSAIDSINNKFSALGVVAFSVLNNIVNKATDAGLRMVKSLSVDQITAGWSKFTQKTGSVATLISQGYNLDEVNKQMERLNWFTDETSYNYTDMASNIAKFTSTGQDLESSVTAMMGIANWAALSGQNATVASRAMYQLSQAMSKGALRYDDWRSIQNASMDTKEFRQQALDAAVALGLVKKNLNDTYTVGKKTYTLNEMFTSEALTRTNWFSSEVMMKTFQKYAGAVDQLYEYTEEHGGTASQAIEELNGEIDAFGLKAFKAAQEARSWADVIDSVKDAVSTSWMSTFEAIFGNYEQATKLWTSLANNLYDVFMFGAEGRNELFSSWNALGGNELMLRSLENVFESLLNIMEAVREAFVSVFPPITADTLLQISMNVARFTERLKDNEELISTVKTVAEGFFHALHFGIQIYSTLGRIVIGVLKAVLKFISPLTSRIRPLIISISEWITTLDKNVNVLQIFSNALNYLKVVLEPFKSILSNVVESFKNFLSVFFHRDTEKESLSDHIKEFGNKVAKLTGDTDKAQQRLEKFTVFFNKVKAVCSKAAEQIKIAFGKIYDVFRKDDGSLTTTFANTGFIAVLAMSFKKFIGALTGDAKEFGGIIQSFKGIGNNINKVFSTISTSLVSFQKSIKVKTLKQVAISIAILAGAILVLSLIDPKKLFQSLMGLSGLFAELGAFVTIFEKVNKNNKFKTIDKLSTSMIKLSVAVLILAVAMKSLSKLSLAEIGKGLLAVAGLLGATVGAAILLSKYARKAAKGAKGMIGFAIAIGILGAVMKSLSGLSWEEFGVGILSVLSLVGILVGASLLLSNFGKKMAKGATSMLAFSAAIWVLSRVMKSFYGVSWEDIGKGLTAILVLAGGISGFAILAGLAKHILSTAAAFVIIAAAMSIFTNVMAKFAELSWEEIGKSFTVFGGIMAVVSIMSIVLSKTGSTMALIGLAAGLLVLGIAMHIFQSAFAKMGAMEWEEIGKGFVVFAGALVLLGAAAMILGPATGGVLAIAGAFALLGLGLQLIASAFVTLELGAALRNIQRGLEGVAAKLRSGMFVQIFKNMLEVLKEFVKFIPIFFAALAEGVVEALANLAKSGAKLVPAIVGIVTILLDALDELLPRIVEFALNVILMLLEGIDEHIEDITIAAGNVITHFLIGLSEALPMITAAAMILMYNFILGLAEAIDEYGYIIWAAMKKLLASIMNFFISAFQDIAELIPGPLGDQLYDGLEDLKDDIEDALVPEDLDYITKKAADDMIAGLQSRTGTAKEAGEDVGNSAIYGLDTVLELFGMKGEESITEYAGGLDENQDKATGQAEGIAKKVAAAFKKADFEGAGKFSILGYLKGLKNPGINSDINDAASAVGENAIKFLKGALDSNSPSKAFEKEGYNSDAGYAQGLYKFSNLSEDAAYSVGEKALTAITYSVSKISDYINDNMDQSPTIRPVFDNSAIVSGVQSINDAMNKSYTLSTTGSSLASQNARLFSMQTAIEKANNEKDIINELSKLRNDVNSIRPLLNKDIYLDGKRVGKYVSSSVNREMYNESVKKGRNN